MEIEILDSDTVFANSPDAGEADCICSRCSKVITADEVPLRAVHPRNNTEVRYCDNCQRQMGFNF